MAVILYVNYWHKLLNEVKAGYPTCAEGAGWLVLIDIIVTYKYLEKLQLGLLNYYKHNNKSSNNSTVDPSMSGCLDT
jgi:hypothetical protein